MRRDHPIHLGKKLHGRLRDEFNLRETHARKRVNSNYKTSTETTCGRGSSSLGPGNIKEVASTGHTCCRHWRPKAKRAHEVRFSLSFCRAWIIPRTSSAGCLCLAPAPFTQALALRSPPHPQNTTLRLGSERSISCRVPSSKVTHA